MRSEINLAYLLAKPLNKRLVVNTLKGMRFLFRAADKCDGNPTYVIENPIK